MLRASPWLSPLRWALLAATGLLARPALAQSAATTYRGALYPGGPDSLRAGVARQLREASPAWVGSVFVRLALGADGTVQKAQYLLPPPGTPAATLVRNANVQEFATRLVRRLPRWQPNPAVIRLASWQFDEVLLQLPFGSTGPAPLAYADELPTFAVPAGQPPLGYYASDAARFLNRQFRYPAEALRAQTQGVLYVYFEVSETGAIERRQVVGSLSASMDTEALRVLNLLPAAATPARQRGQPVRVYFVLPLQFRVVPTPQHPGQH